MILQLAKLVGALYHLGAGHLRQPAPLADEGSRPAFAWAPRCPALRARSLLLAFRPRRPGSALPKAIRSDGAAGRAAAYRRLRVLPAGYGFNLTGSTLYASAGGVFNRANATQMTLPVSTQIVMMLTLLVAQQGRGSGAAERAWWSWLATCAQFGLKGRVDRNHPQRRCGDGRSPRR